MVNVIEANVKNLLTTAEKELKLNIEELLKVQADLKRNVGQIDPVRAAKAMNTQLEIKRIQGYAQGLLTVLDLFKKG
jgi:hypothetical protein